MSPNVTLDSINFKNKKYIQKFIDQEISLIRQFKPDCVITDFRFTAYASATICKTKLVALFVGNALPYGAILPVMGKPKILFKAIRKTEKMKVDAHSDTKHIDEELADIVIFLCSIANRYNIDLEQAFRKKEEYNKTRAWK
jgi:hypothetical protein